ncbi:hypothetical protein CRYUN_Cryun41cG0050300 [Craigia yunnanensis]
MDERKGLISQLKVKPIHFDQIQKVQQNDLTIAKLKQQVKDGVRIDYQIKDDDVLVMGNRLCVPQDEELRKMILGEAHSAPYALHPRSVKMYRTLREHYWWQGIKRDIAEFVFRCLACQQVKAEHQKPSRRLNPLPIP